MRLPPFHGEYPPASSACLVDVAAAPIQRAVQVTDLEEDGTNTEQAAQRYLAFRPTAPGRGSVGAPTLVS